MELNGFLGIEFGSAPEKAVAEIEGKRNGSTLGRVPADELLYFYGFRMANRPVDRAYFFYHKNQLAKVRVLFNHYPNLHAVLEDYSTIKTELNDRYYITDNDYINYTAPAYADDDFDNTEFHMKKQLIEYAAYWNFPVTGQRDNYVILKINSDLQVEVCYEHGDLHNAYLLAKKMEW